MLVFHGLFGSMLNWRSLCQKPAISNQRTCYLIEQRNHIESDHHPEHTYELLAEDALRFMDQNAIEKATMLGHSMGARVSQRFATLYPERTDGVIAVDSAPVDLNPIVKPDETSRVVMQTMRKVTDQ